MKMHKFMRLFWLLLLGFASSLHQLCAESPPGFISLDCGLRDSVGYNDPSTGLSYTPDGAYVETGQGVSISPAFKTSSLARQYFNVRSFPGPQGTRSCYTLVPVHGKGNKILLRVGFMYGNYDDKNKVPQFDLYLGVNHWETVTFEDASSFFTTEILHIPTSDSLQVCLVNTGLGTPFISVLELRSLDPSKLAYNTTSGSLKLLSRWDLGSATDKPIRYKDDMYDRTWKPGNVTNSTVLRSSATNFYQNQFAMSAAILSTASQARTKNDSLVFSFSPSSPSDQVYMYYHFSELVAKQTREITIYINGEPWYKPFVLDYLDSYTVFSITPDTQSNYEVKINTTANSTLPAILNAFELYTVQQFPYPETDENDVSAINGVKATYLIARNWQGDPCYPNSFMWSGLSCRYNGFEPPVIISLNLSSSGLTGTIAPSISNLTMLESLDLSYNNLTGEVPEFLSWLPSLKYLYLNGNIFTGSLPAALQEKSKNGSLIALRFDHSDPCGDDPCEEKKKSTLVVPIVVPVVSFLAILALSTFIYMIIRRKRKAAPNVNVVELQPKVKRYSFSKVMSFIKDKKIIGEGGFGTVYHGCMDGVQVAVKLFKVSPEQESKDFQSEVKILATVYHKNLTKILGYCHEGVHKAIIFELMENGNLFNHLLGKNPSVLSWELRLAILIGAGEGLEYLHHGCELPIIHRDIKPENILLTKEFEAKLPDFGLSRIFPFQTFRVIGTRGYVDPEYVDSCVVTERIDIYSFGVVMLVVITGQPAIMQPKTHITEWIPHKDMGSIVDPRLNENYDANAALKVVKLAMACVCPDSSRRPDMHHVVKELKECLPSPQARLERRERRY